MKKHYLSILLFGSLLAVLTLVLQVSKYRYMIGSLNTEVYTTLVATIFTAAGIWLGSHLLRKKNTPVPSVSASTQPQIDEAKLKEFSLNTREYEILGLIAQGLSNKEIGERLFIAIPTVKTHTSNLYSKLGVRSRTQAVAKARELNLI